MADPTRLVIAALVRASVGSSIVSMTMASGIMAAMPAVAGASVLMRAAICLAICGGATALSHVNDAGFWMCSSLLEIDEKTTLKSWTIMETIIGLSGLACAHQVGIALDGEFEDRCSDGVVDGILRIEVVDEGMDEAGVESVAGGNALEHVHIVSRGEPVLAALGVIEHAHPDGALDALDVASAPRRLTQSSSVETLRAKLLRSRTAVLRGRAKATAPLSRPRERSSGLSASTVSCFCA